MYRTGRTPLWQQLRCAFRAAQQPAGLSSPPAISRRQLLAGAAAGMLAACTSNPGRTANRRGGPKIAVVGAGIAGLHATYLLTNAGFDVTLFEGAKHAGGRIQTAPRGAVAPDIYTEIGAEFIDSVHEDMLSLAKHFHLSLIDTQAEGEKALRVAYYAGGRLRSEDEVIAALRPLAATVANDRKQASEEITFDKHSPFDAVLDRTTLRSYFQKNIATDWLQEILEAAYINEFGLDLDDQSALNFVRTIGTDTSKGFEVYGESDQRYKIRGGNQQIVDALAAAVQHTLRCQHLLQALSLTSTGAYQLTFTRPGASSRTVHADIVILCIPFTILRNISLDIPLPPVKLKAINELGYGINGKLILGFQSRFWRNSGFGGDAYASLPFQSGWDSSRLQSAPSGVYTIFPGGTKAYDLAQGTDLQQAARLLPGLNQVFPGAAQQWRGTALRAYWPSNPFVRASYAAYRPGQWTSIRGAEGLTVGNLYFAGEHTSLDWQGYMNGGAETGRRAAQAIIA